MSKTEAARRILFLLAEVARRNFASRQERRDRVAGAFLLLAGKAKASAGDLRMIDRELGEKRQARRPTLLAVAALIALMAMGTARAQTVVTEGRVLSPDGHRATGTIVVTTVTAFTAADGVRVEQFPAIANVVNGTFAISLEPNVAGTAYQAHWQLDDARPRTEFWVVPASGTVGVCAVLATRVGASWVVAGCGGGGAQHWSLITNVSWSGLTSAVWSALVP